MRLLKVIDPGPRTTVQDSGRRGYQHHGLAQGGAADRFAYLYANRLLDNHLDSACLEVTFGGLQLEALANVALAITGADCQAELNGAPVGPWQSLALHRGDRLRFRAPLSGRYTYLAIQGGFHTTKLFGSRSMVLREQLEDHSALATGDELEGTAQTPPPPRCLQPSLRPDYSAELQLRVLPGYQHDQFTAADRARFITRPYRISAQSDRMGYRLEGATLASPPPGIVSEGIALGAVQIPGDGAPIVLLQDRQTIGGYPKLGTVCAVDCCRLAQALPGQEICFRWAELADVQGERMVMERFFATARWNRVGDALEWH